MAFLMLHY